MDRRLTFRRGTRVAALAVAVSLGLVPMAVTPTYAATKPNPNQIMSSRGAGAHAQQAPSSPLNVSPPHRGTGEATGDTAENNAANRDALPETSSGNTGVSPQLVYGPDDRYRITPTTSNHYPASATVLLLGTGEGGACSGFMIAPDTVATAGHCVYNPSTSTWFDNVVAYPGADGVSQPFDYCVALWVDTVVGWGIYADRNYDYGVVKLNCDVGYATGWYGYAWTSASLVGEETLTQGYPQDGGACNQFICNPPRPEVPNTQWGADDYVRDETDFVLYYQNDTYFGDSGDPVFNDYCGYPCALAVHAGTRADLAAGQGTRITEDVFNNYIFWSSI